MPERLKGHDWKSCVPTKNGTEGSNPSLSAIFCIAKNGGEVSPSKVSFGEADSPSNSVIQNFGETSPINSDFKII